MHVHVPTLLSFVQATRDRLTLREVVSDLPTDPGSLFALALVVGFFGLLFHFGRERGGGRPAGKPDNQASGSPPESSG